MNYIKQIRETKKISQVELAKMINMSKGNLSQIEKGSIGISQENLNKIAEALKCSVGQLLGEISVTADITYSIKYYENIDNIYNDANKYDFVNLSDKILKLLQIKEYKNLVISKSNEKNMEPSISNNDFLIIDTAKKEPFNNKIYVIKERDLIKIKRILMKSPNDTNVLVQSDNQIEGEYPPYQLTLYEAKELIIGQIVFYGKSIL